MHYLDLLMTYFKKFVKCSRGVRSIPFNHIWQVCDAQRVLKVRHKEIFQALASICVSLVGSWGESNERVQREGVTFPPNFDARDVGALDRQFEYFAMSLTV